MTSRRFDGKVAIVTGGASGFGEGIAQEFSRAGAKVIIADISADLGAQTASKIEGCHFVKADVTERKDWEALLKYALDNFGQLDYIINNAGTSYVNKPTEEVTDAEFDMTFKVNVLAIHRSTAVLLPYFLKGKKKAVFITIGSTGGIRPRPGLVWYNSSKAAAMLATKNMAVEYAPRGIRFNSVCPVFGGNTRLSSHFIGKEDNEENRKKFSEVVPLGRDAHALDVANACVYLCSDEACFITGVDLPVDGGRCV